VSGARLAVAASRSLMQMELLGVADSSGQCRTAHASDIVSSGLKLWVAGPLISVDWGSGRSPKVGRAWWSARPPFLSYCVSMCRRVILQLNWDNEAGRGAISRPVFFVAFTDSS
jgi:hypothetical protein